MRIISGQYGGRLLKSPPDHRTRPTSGRLRETLFNILAPRIEGTRFLDLCAGSGAIGIEALSRGADFVTFVDRSKKACALIEENLDKLGVPEDETDVQNAEAETFVGRPSEASWDIAFYDPPYEANYSVVIHEFGDKGNLLAEDGILIVEHLARKPMPDIEGSLRRWRLLKQGDTHLSFYEKA
ncbi:MAG: RsmD family RNA methyltransferase [Acidobacteria bacterium OLB17]|nr:MAG: RsmD family RNA methyltransferase [Acidobacteria bacterium OLB17]MCZ2389476.1 16S rRNA (guanine(966)-N(2))-methyltransferase RsmD [Acidobacteriota bacterium]